ncbi:MAG TPA: DUF402 domain-containing protein [Caulobacteraceae bacterium]|nr:DUF402 domain-containing protein [Caulobacteraceae bacterium]
MRRWAAGETVVVRNIARSDDTVTSALPAIAIGDDDAALALYIPAGTVAKDNYVVPPAERAASVATAAASAARRHVDRTWAAPSLRLYLPGEAFSVWLFFDAGHGFTGWYGNLEAPFVRTALGIDTRDHGLDVVADAKRRWRWKDEDEFAARLARGLDTAEHQTAVRAAGRSFIARLEAGTSPFDDGWPDWRPPAGWTPRDLPDDWRADLGSGPQLR